MPYFERSTFDKLSTAQFLFMNHSSYDFLEVNNRIFVTLLTSIFSVFNMYHAWICLFRTITPASLALSSPAVEFAGRTALAWLSLDSQAKRLDCKLEVRSFPPCFLLGHYTLLLFDELRRKKQLFSTKVKKDE